MPNYTYLIIGGGMTADAAAQGIREGDPAGTIGLISAEPHPPYNRPPLSKGLWKGEPEESTWRKTEAAGVELHLGRNDKQLSARDKQALDDGGTVYTFGKLLFSTAGRMPRLPFVAFYIIYSHTLDD